MSGPFDCWLPSTAICIATCQKPTAVQSNRPISSRRKSFSRYSTAPGHRWKCPGLATACWCLPCWAVVRNGRSANSSRQRSAARSAGPKATANRTQVPTWLRFVPKRAWKAMNGSSMGRKSGALARTRHTTCSCWHAPSQTHPNMLASPTCWLICVSQA
ncbi:hypothetical protein D9M71_635150 [compost metagenome]